MQDVQGATRVWNDVQWYTCRRHWQLQTTQTTADDADNSPWSRKLNSWWCRLTRCQQTTAVLSSSWSLGLSPTSTHPNVTLTAKPLTPDGADWQGVSRPLRCCLPLNPWGYTLHLKCIRTLNPDVADWQGVSRAQVSGGDSLPAAAGAPGLWAGWGADAASAQALHLFPAHDLVRQWPQGCAPYVAVQHQAGTMLNQPKYTLHTMYIILYCIILYYIMLYEIILHNVTWHCIIQYNIILMYCKVMLYHIIL